MGFLQTFFGVAASAASGPVAPVANLATSIIDRVLPDKTANDAAKAKLAEMALSGELAQIQGQLTIDNTEAGSQSVFVAGWRPFIGWICGVGLLYEFLIQPLLTFAFAHWHIVAPNIGTQDVIALVTTMLGMGVMRTVDKAQGTGGGH